MARWKKVSGVEAMVRKSILVSSTIVVDRENQVNRGQGDVDWGLRGE